MTVRQYLDLGAPGYGRVSPERKLRSGPTIYRPHGEAVRIDRGQPPAWALDVIGAVLSTVGQLPPHRRRASVLGLTWSWAQEPTLERKERIDPNGKPVVYYKRGRQPRRYTSGRANFFTCHISAGWNTRECFYVLLHELCHVMGAKDQGWHPEEFWRRLFPLAAAFGLGCTSFHLDYFYAGGRKWADEYGGPSSAFTDAEAREWLARHPAEPDFGPEEVPDYVRRFLIIYRREERKAAKTR